MTVPLSNYKETYLTNGVTVNFPYTWKINATSELIVTKTIVATGVAVTATEGIGNDYTVTGAGVAGGGNVVWNSTLASGFRITIEPNMALVQLTDFENQGGFYADTHEDEIDRSRMIDRMFQAQLDRCFKVPSGSTVDPDAVGEDIADNYSLVAYVAEELLSRYGSLATAITGIGATEAQLIIDQDVTLTGNLTVPSNITLRCVKGNTFEGAYTLTINGPIIAGNWKIFESDITIEGTSPTGRVVPQWWGAVGDGVTDDSAPLKSAVAFVAGKNGGTVFLPFGTYKTTETIYLKGISALIGEGMQKVGGTAFDIGGSAIHAVHTGAAVISLKGADFVKVQDITLEADQSTAPKAGLVLGRDSAASAGNNLIERVRIQGAFSVACIYSIASEENVYRSVYAWLYADNSGLFDWYCAEQDLYSVDSLTTSTNISGYCYGCSFINSSSHADSAVIKIDAAGQTGGFCFTSNYLVANAGSYFFIENSSASDILGPFILTGVNGERLGAGGDPAYGVRMETTTPCIIRGFNWLGSRFSFQAGAAKKTIYVDSDISLYNPNVCINPEEASPYAVADYNRANIQGGIFSVSREAIWTAMTLAGTWANRFGSPYAQAGYKLSPEGTVTLRGELDSGTGLITTLPANYRPTADMRIKTQSDGGLALIVIVASTGTVTLSSGTATGLDLNNISFQTN